MPPRPSEPRAGESGAVAVLYAFLLVVMLGVTALTIDLGALRADRHGMQRTADVASTAGVLSMYPEFGGGSAEIACQYVWDYFLTNTPEATPGADPCATRTDWSCTSGLVASFEERSVVGLADPYEVTIVWPVLDDDEVMVGDGYSEEVDGDAPCERLGMLITRTRGFVFGQVLNPDFAVGSTGASAVARAWIVKEDDIIAALVVLDPHDCEAIRAGGGGEAGAIHVFEAEPFAPGDLPGLGVIAVDSDGTGSGCNNTPTISHAGAGTSIKAGVVDDGTGQPAMLGGQIHVRRGAIYNYALTPSGNAPASYDPADVAAGRLAGGDDAPPLPGNPPVPPLNNDRVERTPWHHRYDCRDTYTAASDNVHEHIPLEPCEGRFDAQGNMTTPPGSAYITKFRQRIGSYKTLDTDGLEAAGFNVVTGTPRCDIDGVDFSTPGDWWFDCDLRVGTGEAVVIEQGDVVVMGDVDLQGGLFSLRAAPNVADGVLYIDGNFSKAGGAALVLGRDCSDPLGDACNDGQAAAGVAVILADGPSSSKGRMDLGGSAGEAFTWVAPYRPVTFRGEFFDFEDLALWTEYTRSQNQPLIIRGDVSNLIADGIYYMPNAWFSFRGGGAMGQQRAQFVAYRTDVRGGGKLLMRPDPARAEELFGIRIALIR